MPPTEAQNRESWDKYVSEYGVVTTSVNCTPVHNNAIRPLMGTKAYVHMKIIHYVDNDELKKPQTASIAVYSVDNTAFGEGVGQLACEQHIIVNRTVDLINNKTPGRH